MEQDDRFVRSRYAPGPERAPAPLFWRPKPHVDRAPTPDLHSPVILGTPAPMDRDEVHELFEEFLTKRGEDSALDFLAWVEATGGAVSAEMMRRVLDAAEKEQP